MRSTSISAGLCFTVILLIIWVFICMININNLKTTTEEQKKTITAMSEEFQKMRDDYGLRIQHLEQRVTSIERGEWDDTGSQGN